MKVLELVDCLLKILEMSAFYSDAFHMPWVHQAMENIETCRMFVEKKGIESLMRLLSLPSTPLYSEGCM